MSTTGPLNRLRSMRIIVVFMAMLLAYGAVSYSPQAAEPIKVYSIELGGITGAANNIAFADGRFALVAPYAPSNGIDKKGYLDLTQLDNRFLYVIDTKKPNNTPLRKELTAWDPKTGEAKPVYFPTRVVFDPRSNIAYVRGTRFEGTDREVQPIDVIAYVHLNFDKGDPSFDTVVAIDIQGVSADYTNEAPMDFALGAKNLLVFTNGASIFSYNLDHGYLYRLQIVPPNEYSADDSISFLDVDPATNVVSVCRNRTAVGKDKVVRVSSEISFYKLLADGKFQFLKGVSPDKFPEGTALAHGSNITIVSDPDKEDSEVGLFVTADGTLCAVDLHSDNTDPVERLYSFRGLAQSNSDAAGRLLVQYDPSKRVVGIVRPGFIIQISRPVNGRRGRISRPVNIAYASPVFAMARLDKKNKVTSANTFTEDFKVESGLSNFVNGENSEWLISTYSGKLYSVSVADADLRDSKLQFIGPIGSRVERIDYYADRSSIVAIESFELSEDGPWVGTPGSLIIGRLQASGTQSAANVLQALLPTASVLGRSAPSIRRPCNIKR